MGGWRIDSGMDKIEIRAPGLPGTDAGIDAESRLIALTLISENRFCATCCGK
jgi:hypothetical protein